jgi:hypothetical protein
MIPEDEQLVSEAIEPDLDAPAGLPFRVGDPIVPGRFLWRGRAYAVAAILESW